MTVLRSLVMAFACFSRIPVPNIKWQDDSMRYMMCFFPLVGVAVGLLVWLWLFVCDLLGFGAVVRAAGIALVPIVVTGGIHVDGLADVFDAQSSHAEPARKREILKDPHLGAFAAIGVVSYMIAYFALGTEVPALAEAWNVGLLFVGMHALSRCLSGIATTVFAGSTDQGMLAQERSSADKGAVVALAVEALVFAAVLVVSSPIAGAAMVAAGLLSLAWLHVFSRRQFGGMSGDLAGCFLQVAELAMLACLVVLGKVVGL